MKDICLLVASDIVSDAELLKKLLRDEFENVFVSTDPNKSVADFERHKPDVLILAFNLLEKAERYYLGLYRQSTLLHTLPHRTLTLCGRDEVQHAYELCRKDYFDDYVQFWPMTNDAPRLLMAVHNALRDLRHMHSGTPVAEMAQQVRRIAELEELLNQQLGRGDLHAQTAIRSLERSEVEIDAAIDNFSKTVFEGGLGGALEVRNRAQLQQEIDNFKSVEVRQRFRALNDVMQPLAKWVSDMKQQLEPHLESMSSLKTLAEHFRPVVLLVDDNEFERKLTAEMLRAEPYELIFAASGVEALGLMRKKRPDLILMDMVMPELSGLETLRRLKAAPQFAAIPVMMITGQSEKELVVECLKAGAVDFLVKPLARDVLLKKVATFLAG